MFPTKLAESLVSYGSCQFPTLGFVVERYRAVENFVGETFWKIKGMCTFLTKFLTSVSLQIHSIYVQKILVSQKKKVRNNTLA